MPTAILLLSGCFGLFGSRPGQSGLSRKPVSRKEPPTSLIAIDNTRCLVTEEKYRDTPVGTSVTCFWTSDRDGRVVTGGNSSEGDAPQRKVSGKVSDMTAKGAAPAAGAKKPND
jgi:hypothetical protein